MNVVIWLPYRGTSKWRRRNFDAVYRQAKTVGYPVVVADSGDEPFSIARTWNWCAAEREWDVAVRWAADFVVADVASVHAAVEAVNFYTLAFDESTSLNQAETRTVHAGGPLPDRVGKPLFGGVNAVTRDLWETVGGFDERFVGYGFEDMAFVRCVHLLYGPRERVPGRMFNLWHPRKTPSEAYWAARERNLAMYRRDYEPITTREDLLAFLASRG